MKQIEFEGQTHQFPDDFSDADISAALSGPKSASTPKPLDTTGRLKAALVKEPDAGAHTLFGETDMPGRVVRAVGDMFLPGTNAQAGAMAGTMLAPVTAATRYVPQAVRALAESSPALARIFGATVGGGAGGAVEGGASGALEGAAKGGAAATVGEGLGKAASVVTRSLPGAKGAIAAQDAERAGGAVGGMSPGLAPGATVQDIRRAAVNAPARLGAAKEAAVQELETKLPGGVPSRYKDIGSPPAGYSEPGEWVAGARAAAERSPFSSPLPPTHIDMPSLGKSMSLRDANAELSRIGDMLRGRVPLDPRYKDANLGQLYKEAAKDIEGGVTAAGGPEAGAAWRQLQGEYKAGRAAIKPFQTGAAYRPGTTADEMQLNTPYLQRWLVNPKNEAYLRSKLLPGQFSALETALTRGGGAGSADILAPGRGGALDALMEILRGKGGATQIPALAPRTLLPGLASQHAGRAPYPMPPALQTILDLAAERGSDVTSSGR